MDTPNITDRVVKVTAYLTDEEFGYNHWRAAQFASPKGKPAILLIFDTEAECAVALRARLAVPPESFEDCIRRIAEPMDAKAKAFAERLLAAVPPAASEPSDETVARELVFLWGCVVGTTEPSTAARRENESALVWVRAVNAARERARGKR